MKTILEPEKDYNWAGNSDTGRIEIWKRGLTFMAEDPILGAGASNYQNKQGRSEWARQLQAQGRGVPWQAAHNGYLQIGVELGIPGLLTFLAIIWLTMRNLWRSARWRHVPPRKRQGMELLLAGLVGFSVGTVFISSAYWAFFYVTIALCCAAVSIASRAPAALFQVPDTRAPHTGRASRRQRTQSRVAAVATARP